MIDPRSKVIDLLARFGPDAPPPPAPPTPQQALAYCHGLTRSHGENFSVLTRLVPPTLRDGFAAVYAFCRWSDDLADELGRDAQARARATTLLRWWRGGLSACFGDAHAPPPTHPVFVALRSVRVRHPQLDAQPFHHLLDAFEQDQVVTRYQTWDQCVDYCTRSANPVGRIVLALGGYADGPGRDERFALSDATCTALQLINFWQDVRRDLLDRDRVYLPHDDTGLSPDQLRDWLNRGDDPSVRIAYIKALRPLVERTAALFQRGRPLPRMLDRPLGRVVWLFGAGGEATLRAVERAGCATLWQRPRVGKLGKLLLVARAALT